MADLTKFIGSEVTNVDVTATRAYIYVETGATICVKSADPDGKILIEVEE